MERCLWEVARRLALVKGGFLVIRVVDIYTYVNLKEFGPNLSKEIHKNQAIIKHHKWKCFSVCSRRKASKDNSTASNDDNLRLALEEKEQALLASQETVQVCNHAKLHVSTSVCMCFWSWTKNL